MKCVNTVRVQRSVCYISHGLRFASYASGLRPQGCAGRGLVQGFGFRYLYMRSSRKRENDLGLRA
jgi:hypothetical protein